jgi:hypothetical protein
MRNTSKGIKIRCIKGVRISKRQFFKYNDSFYSFLNIKGKI